MKTNHAKKGGARRAGKVVGTNMAGAAAKAIRPSKKFITIAGNIGVGKSTLTARLAERYGWKPYYEVVDTNPYLSDFYGDMRRWSFHLQVFFLSKRFQHHKAMVESPHTVVQDRSIYEDAEIFAKGLWLQGKFEERDYKNYIELFRCMSSYLRPPDLLVALRASVPALLDRIQNRGRHCERDISHAYLAQLNQHYDLWFQNYDKGPILIVDSDSMDFASDQAVFEKIAAHIHQNLYPTVVPRAKPRSVEAVDCGGV